MDNLVEVKSVCMDYDAGSTLFKKKTNRVLDHISFDIKKGEILGLVGESGCGKSTVGRCILNMLKPSEGAIYYDGEEINDESMGHLRKKMQMVFQDPYSSLDPKMTAMDIISEPLFAHDPGISKAEAEERVYELIDIVGLKREHARRYPHEFSGGQRQRVGIARALAPQPEFIVCDEPVSALDVSVKAQIINTFGEVADKYDLSYLFITHDLLTARYISDRVAVMYLGRIMEIGDMEEVIKHPAHPYTTILFSAVAVPDPRTMATKKRIPLIGEVPDPAHRPSGCPFRTRCPIAKEICELERPELKEISNGHFSACHFPGEGGLKLHD